MLSGLLVTIGLLLPADQTTAATVHHKTGYAYDAKSGDLLYLERHARFVSDGETVGQLVRYEDPDGILLATKRIDYRQDPLTPEFVLTDRRTGYVEGMVRTAEGPKAFCRRGSQAGLDQEAIEDLQGALADAGFDRLIETRWDDLLAGETITRPFLVPSRLSTVKFSIELDRRYDLDGLPVAEFTMKPRNGMLRLFVDPIRVAYDMEDRMLVEYRGISNLRDEELENYDVRIDFPLAERGVDTVAALPDFTVRPEGPATASVTLTSAE